MNPKCPKKFESILDTNGVYYALKFPENNLLARVTLIDSFVVPGGLYFSTEYSFSPNQLDYLEASEVVEKQDNFIIKSLELNLTEEV